MKAPAQLKSDIASQTLSRNCRCCGRELTNDELEGLCAACLWRSLVVIESEPPEGNSAFNTAPLLRLEGYEILEEIARGGMGIVYRARQFQPPRQVAVKMLLPHQVSSAEMRERFRLEIRATAELEHPAILPVYQVGEHTGLPFFVMKLATGGTLAERHFQYDGKWREVAELMARLCDAVQFAHERGLLHRDLKPGNILFDDAGRAYVSDFGLAKFIDTLEETSALTRSMSVLGTPQYMAPEIATKGPKAATTSADLYSLGAILYELLAGNPPFEAAGVTALLKKISNEEPVKPGEARAKVEGRKSKAEKSPNEINRIRNDEGRSRPHSNFGNHSSIPRDLEIICLKCLAKEPSSRYGSARELAEDLRRWLRGEPIDARPVSKLERCWKWVMRNPLLSLLAAALVLCLSLSGVALLESYHQTRKALDATREAETKAQGNLRDALLAQAQALGAAHSSGQRWQALDALARAARIRPSIELRNEAAAALARPDLKEVNRFEAMVGAAGSSVVFSSDLETYFAAEPNGGFARRSTRGQKLLASFPGTLGKPALWFVLSPDDRHVAATLADYSLEVWAVDGDKPLLKWPGNYRQPPVAEFHPDGRSLAGFVSGEGLFLRNLDGTERRTLQSTNSRAIFLRFDPTGDRLAVVRDPGEVELWRCQPTPALLWTQFIPQLVPWLAWSPDGRKLMAAANDGRGLRVCSAQDGQVELVYSRHLLYPREFEFAPDGQTAASIGEDWTLRLWDAKTGQDMVTGVGRHRVTRFSKDGTRLTTAPSDRELAVLERAPGQVFREFSSSPSEYVGDWLRRSPDDGYLLVCQPQIRLYDTKHARQAGAVGGLPFFLGGAFFDSLGSSILYSRPGKGMYRRAFKYGASNHEIEWEGEEQVAPFSEGVIWETIQSNHSWVCHKNDSVEVWGRGNARQIQNVAGVGPWPGVIASQNGAWIASANFDEQIQIRKISDGEVVTNLPIHRPSRVWFSPDSEWLMASTEQGYSTWNTRDWRAGTALPTHLDSGNSGIVSFSDDSRLVAVRQERETFRLLSFPDCRELVTLKPPLLLPVRDACLSSDGKRLWLLAASCRIFEWNLAALRQDLQKIRLDWED